MKSKLFWSCCTVLVASLPIPAFAQTAPQASIDYKVGSMIKQDLSIKSNHPITDKFIAEVVARPQSYPQAISTWESEISECMQQYPLLLEGPNNPILFNDKPGTIVRNANNRAVCKIRE